MILKRNSQRKHGSGKLHSTDEMSRVVLRKKQALEIRELSV